MWSTPETTQPKLVADNQMGPLPFDRTRPGCRHSRHVNNIWSKTNQPIRYESVHRFSQTTINRSTTKRGSDNIVDLSTMTSNHRIPFSSPPPLFHTKSKYMPTKNKQPSARQAPRSGHASSVRNALTESILPRRGARRRARGDRESPPTLV